MSRFDFTRGMGTIEIKKRCKFFGFKDGLPYCSYLDTVCDKPVFQETCSSFVRNDKEDENDK